MSQDREKQELQLVESQQAVYTYLEELLKEVDEKSLNEGVVPTAEMQSGEHQAVAYEPGVVAARKHPDEEEPGGESSDRQCPDWAEQPFQCLLFEVRGVVFAVPLVDLDAIVQWNVEPTFLPMQPDWHLGVFLHRGEQVIAVDTAQVVMPERLEAEPEKAGMSSHLLVIGGGRWGLACDRIRETVYINKDEVRWTLADRVRPWMFGIVVDRLCVLLDIGELEKQIGHE